MDKGLQTIPGVGRSIAKDLMDLGYRSVEDLKGADPEAMYRQLCALRESHIDRCMLYVFRCAVYFAGHTEHDPERLKWWNWKDEKLRVVHKKTRPVQLVVRATTKIRDTDEHG